MKFSISSSELLKQLQIAVGTISSNPSSAIMEGFLFSIQDSVLTISATDNETAISTEMDVMADFNGKVAIPGKILMDTLKALPAQPITFQIDDKNFGIEITSAYGKYKLAGENGADFPAIPTPDEVEAVSLSGLALLQGISKTIFATSTDDLRPAMMGVYFQIDTNKISMVATDAHKLVRYVCTDITSTVTSSFIMPKKALNLLKTVVPADAEITLSFNNSYAFFTFNKIKLVCRLIDNKYPDYNAVIPVDNPLSVQISRHDFQNSLKRIAIYANKTTNQVVLNITKGSMTVSAQDLDFSNEAIEQLPCNYDGSPLVIAFNAKFMAEMLGVLDSEEVLLELSTPSRAGLMFPSEQKEGTDILMLVMPVMLSN
jgi:DNA polymerase-3 subunit beta